MKPFRVLVVDDEERILNFLGIKLKASGYEVLTAKNGVQALDILKAELIDLVVLDLMMPVMDGFETLKELRTFNSVAIIFLTAKNSDDDKIRGLRLGADDYLSKPFNPDELIARIEAVRRRSQVGGKEIDHPDLFTYGDLIIDFKNRVASSSGQDIYFTRMEWNLLKQLIQNEGRFMSYEELLSRVWGPEYCGDIQLLRTWISRLRSKIEKDKSSPKLIKTVPKSGYSIDRSNQETPAGRRD